MTITVEPVALSYDGDDVTTDFPVTFKYFAKSDVLVTHRDASGVETTWVLDTDYTLTVAGVESGGTLTATTAPATGEIIVIELDPPNTQDSSIPLGGSFPSTTVEDELDQAVQRDVKIERLFERSLRVPTTDLQTGPDLNLPIDSLRASKFLAFDANGKPIAAAGTSADLGPVTPFIDTLLDDVDAATARATLLAAGTAANNAFTGSNTFEKGINYIAASGTNAYTATLSPAITAYQTGAIYYISFANANTSTTPTLNLNSLGAKTIINIAGSALIAGEVDGYHVLQYDGTNLRLLNPHRPRSRGALVYNSSNQSIAHGSEVTLNFDSEDYDTDSIHDTVTNNSRLTVPSGASKILLKGQVLLANGADYTGAYILVNKNGVSTGYAGKPRQSYAETTTSLNPILNTSSPIIRVSSGDYFELVIAQYNTATAARNAQPGGFGDQTWFAMEIIE